MLAPRALAALIVVPLLATTAACGGGFSSGGGKDVTVVGQNFPEADVMTELYKGVLEHAGFKVKVKSLGARDVYLSPLEKGDVQVSTDYLSSMTEALNTQVNGEGADPVASADPDATLKELNKLAGPKGLTALQPAQAQDANAYAVTQKFARANKLATLSDLAELGRPISIAANSDCKERRDCGAGLEKVYGIKVKEYVPYGFGSVRTKDALVQGKVDVGQVGTTDPTLSKLSLVILTDDKQIVNAENLVPIANTDWIKKNPMAAKALDELSTELTTKDLTTMLEQVQGERLPADKVAADYLHAKGLV